jgi:hypothetical protein
MQFYYKRDTDDGRICGIIDVDTLEGLAEQLEDFLDESKEGEIIIFRIEKGSVLDEKAESK